MPDIDLKPECEWTEADRVCMAEMEAVHRGTWRPTVDGGLRRVSLQGPWGTVGTPRAEYSPLIRDLLATVPFKTAMAIMERHERYQDWLTLHGRPKTKGKSDAQ